ncbi:MAG: hypothetical protein IPH86_15585 [bacterium]|nr:hypothetical protein [bacterium]MBK7671289.1 hypothetical protein [bacterium]
MTTLMHLNKHRLLVEHHFQLGALVQAFETCGVAPYKGAAWSRESRNALAGPRTADPSQLPVRRKTAP